MRKIEKKKNFIVSIIVVTLNNKKGLSKTLDSIFSQKIKKKKYETIVIDGLSNDGTKDIILKNKKKINSFVIEKDDGIYNAMNKGLKYANGKWVNFLNSGDIFYNQFTLNKILNYCEKKNKVFDIIYGDTILDYHFTKKKKFSKKISQKNFEMPFCHQSAFIKLSLHKKKLYSENFLIASDFNFFNWALVNGARFKKINKLISIVETGGIGDNKRFKTLYENLLIKLKYKGNFFYFASVYILFISYTLLSKIIKLILPKKIIFGIIKNRK